MLLGSIWEFTTSLQMDYRKQSKISIIIIFQVNRAYIAGDITRAKKASAAAKKHSIISIVVGAVLWILVSIWIIYFYFVFFPKMMQDGMQERLNTLQEQLHTVENLKSFTTKPTTH